MVNQLLTGEHYLLAMQSIQLNQAERAALKKLVKKEGSCNCSQLLPDQVQRLVDLGFVLDTGDSYHLTLRGQIEYLRLHFRRMPRPSKSVTISDSTNTLLDTRAFGRDRRFADSVEPPRDELQIPGELDKLSAY